MNCVLCQAVKEDFRLIRETKHSFCVIALWPLNKGHVLVIPKKHVTQVLITQLNDDELRDFNTLVQEMEDLLNEKFNEDVITFKNSGKHSTQVHLHYHLLPSKGSLRDLVGTYENVPKRKDIPTKQYTEMRDYILKEK